MRLAAELGGWSGWGDGGSPGAEQSCASSGAGGGGCLNWEHEALLQPQRETGSRSGE